MQIFVSYAHDDSDHLAEFIRNFTPAARVLGVTLWHDRQLHGGQMWNPEIGKALESSSAFVLLATNNFLKSEYIVGTELPAIADAKRDKNALVLPVIVRRCFWRAYVKEIQVIPTDDGGRVKPVLDWRPARDAWPIAAEQVAAAMERHFKLIPKAPVDWAASKRADP